MSSVLEIAGSFPRDDYLRLLRNAEHLFASTERRRELLHSLGLATDEHARPRVQRPGAQEDAPTTGGGLEGAPFDHFAARLVDLLSDPSRLDLALKLARRISHDIGVGDDARALLATLEELYVGERMRGAQEPMTEVAEPPGSWMGFHCVHTYSLSDRFFGREEQLARLDAWIAANGAEASVLSLHALGGCGKSALAWHWLNRVLQSLPKAGYRGAFWCSFYEKDFDFGDFLRRALVFSSGMAPEAVALLPRAEVERMLLDIMQREPFIFVVDGLERLMNGYAVVFDRAIDPESVPGGKQEQDVTPHDRRLTDPRSGAFLRRLAGRMASRLLITSRLGPADLEEPESGRPLPRVGFLELRGLDPPDAAALWTSIVPGSPVTDELRAIFTLSGHHALVISILARSVAAAGDWDTWRRMESHRDFAPREAASEPDVRAHVIGVCIRDLREAAYDVLGVLTTSGKPMPLELVGRVLVQASAAGGDGRWTSPEQVAGELERLVSLGFVGAAVVDGRTEYDVHPVVRGAAWGLITDARRERFLSHALSEFYATPDRQEGGIDLNKAMSLFQLLVRSQEIDRAWEMYYNKLWMPLALRSDNRTLLDLFEILLPDGDPLRLLPLSSRREQANATEVLGSLLMTAGDGDRSDRLLRWCGAIRLQIGDFLGFLNARHGRSWQTLYEGRLFETELDLRAMRADALHFGAAEIVPAIDCWIGIVLALRGETTQARHYFELSRDRTASFRWWAQGLAEGYVYLGEPEQALEYLAQARRSELHPTDGRMQVVWEALTLGMAHFQRGALDEALDHLSHALEDALRANYAIIQCFAIPHIAEILVLRGAFDDAEAQLDAYFRLDPESRYQLAAADAWRVRALARLARGRHDEAKEYAARAYRLAACDGPPFLYREGVKRALETLESCGAYVPRAEARLHPEWRRLLARVAPPPSPSDSPRGNGATEPPALDSEEQAREFLRVEALLREASENDRRWWAEITSESPSGVALPLAQAMAACGISLESFRAAYEKSAYRSVLVVFHQLHAESIAGGQPTRSVGELDDAGRREWLQDEAQHDSLLTAFLATDHARQVAFAFEVHQLDAVGMAAFLADDKRRIQYERAGIGREWWNRLERARPPRDMLILAESIVLAGVTLQEFVHAVAVGIPRGIEYAFAALRLRRAIASLTVDAVSNSEGWTDVQIFLRLEDVKQRMGWRSASPAAREYWSTYEQRSGTRLANVLRTAEELAIRRGTIDDYHRAHLFTRSDDPDANLAYVEYERLKSVSWNGEPPRRPITFAASAVDVSDTSGWSDERIRARLEVVAGRVGSEWVWSDAMIATRRDASDEVQSWWNGLQERHPAAELLRLVEELEAVRATIAELHLASVEGATENVAAAFAHLTFSRLQRAERRQAQERATAKNREGNAHFENDRYRDAIACYEAAIAEAPDEPVFYTNLANAWERVPDVEPALRLQEVVHVLERGLERAPGSEAILLALAAARNSMRLCELGGYPGPAAVAKLPVVTPIAMEVGANLISLVGDSRGSVVAEAEQVRERIEGSTGVRIPSIRIRGNDTDLPPDSYLVLLDEIPLLLRDFASDKATEDRSAELFGQLEQFLREHLGSFVTLDSVEVRLRREWGGRADEIAGDPVLLRRLARVLRALAEERVPVIAFAEICEAFVERAGLGDDVDGVLCGVRMLPSVRPHLPGNPETRLALSPAIEAIIVDGLRPYGDERLLLLEPEAAQEILQAVRGLVAELPRESSAAIVVESPVARRYVRRLLELEFPEIPVLAREELLAGQEARITNVIDLV